MDMSYQGSRLRQLKKWNVDRFSINRLSFSRFDASSGIELYTFGARCLCCSSDLTFSHCNFPMTIQKQDLVPLPDSMDGKEVSELDPNPDPFKLDTGAGPCVPGNIALTATFFMAY
ncbi:hypothetical protein SUGI_0485810 [Cryptomeria japonica]|nr:hypothetical protein SUGI_0485810 [Cryptomeria japonica]